MRYNKLGRTGLLVSELCLGSNMFGGEDLPNWKRLGGLPQAAVNDIIGHAVDAGINFIDTADGYAAGQSEMRIGAAIRELDLDRHDIVIATKNGTAMGKGVNRGGASRAHIVEGVEGSLHRLQTDYIDLYMIHFFDPVTPIDETLRALDDLVRGGKVRYIGCSNFAAWEVMKALGHSDANGLHRFAAVEEQWSIATREIERELVPLALDQGIGLMLWGPLVGGLLTGKYLDQAGEGRLAGQDLPASIDAERLRTIVELLRSIGERRGATTGQVALAWLLHQAAATSVIVGSRTVDQLEQNIAATEVPLTAQDLEELAAVNPLFPPYGASVVGGARTRRAKLIAPRVVPAA